MLSWSDTVCIVSRSVWCTLLQNSTHLQDIVLLISASKRTFNHLFIIVTMTKQVLLPVFRISNQFGKLQTTVWSCLTWRNHHLVTSGSVDRSHADERLLTLYSSGSGSSSLGLLCLSHLKTCSACFRQLDYAVSRCSSCARVSSSSVWVWVMKPTCLYAVRCKAFKWQSETDLNQSLKCLLSTLLHPPTPHHRLFSKPLHNTPPPQMNSNQPYSKSCNRILDYPTRISPNRGSLPH